MILVPFVCLYLLLPLPAGPDNRCLFSSGPSDDLLNG